MAEEEQQQQPQQPFAFGSARTQWPQIKYMTGDDDYVYEVKPLPKKGAEGQNTQSGGMGAQFETVSSGANNNI